MTGFVYIMSNKRDGTLYVGVTSNLSRRAFEHREGAVEGFASRYGLKRLVYYESYSDIRDALQREKNMKHWPRLWKLALIQDMNPDWADLYESLNRSRASASRVRPANPCRSPGLIRGLISRPSAVMPGLDPGIQGSGFVVVWMAGSSPAMTIGVKVKIKADSAQNRPIAPRRA